MLYEFITVNREEIITRCRAKVATRSFPPPSAEEIDHGVPVFLDQLVRMMQSGGGEGEIDKTAALHGHEMLLRGFNVSQVVHDYGDVCQTVTDLAVETNAPISTEDFRTLNRCLDEAIASAVTTFQLESRQTAAAGDSERLGFLVHELRNLVNTSVIAFEALKRGSVGVAGSTGAVLDRSLSGLRDLIANSLEDVRVTTTVKNRSRVEVGKFIKEIADAATLEAHQRGLEFVVSPVPAGVAVDVDRQLLTSVVGNLVQNAFKFTRAHSTVTLRVVAGADRVRIEVQDECGGLAGEVEGKDLVPAFDQRGADRTGLGIGLRFSQWGVAVNGGKLYARNLPGTGCVFTVDLPQSAMHETALV
jgi:signal transduction histidine kinase